MIHFNLRLALRNLVKNRVYSMLIIGGFAIGFAACILIGLFYHSETTVNKDFPKYKQIYRVYDVKKSRCNLNWDLFPVLKQDFAEVEDACPMEYSTGYRMTAKNEQAHTFSEVKHLLSTTNNFFSIFSVKMVETLGQEPFDRKEAMVLSRETARKLFGTQNPLGQEVNFDNFFTGTVTGIFEDLPLNSTFKADLILNSENPRYRLSNTTVNGRRYNPANLYVLLDRKASPELFTTKLNQIDPAKVFDIDSLALQNLADMYLSPLKVKSKHSKGNPALLKIFLSIAALILLLSSINYLNYSVSMLYAKLKEIGINKTNGASWRNLINYSLIEVSLGIVVALILSVTIALLSLPYAEKLFGKALHIDIHDWISVGPYIMGAVVIVFLINSLAPIYILSKFKITEFLSGFSGKKNQKQYVKQVMLIFQLTTSIALIAVVMIIFKQLYFVNHSDLGFDKDMLVRIDLPHKFNNPETLKEETDKLPYVKGSAISMGCPGMINIRNSSNTGEDNFDINLISVGDDYLKTMGIELLQGREFLSGDVERVCLMNEEAIKQYQWDRFEGKRLENGGGYEVIGVVKDLKVKSDHFKVEPLALVYSKKQEGNIFSVKLAPGNFGQQIKEIQQIWKKLSPYEPMNFLLYDDFFQSMYEKEKKMAASITFFSIIAIVLTCMGILGQIFMICLNRMKEIGIRKINGARISEVMVMLNRDFVKWVATSIVIATPIAWYAMHRWLENFAYKTELSWWIFALAGLMALGITLLTVSFQSWKAATKNPVESLRYE
jgi:putative ABC transport system permease protein